MTLNRVRVAIGVADEALDRIADVFRDCRALGFRSDSTLMGVGVFTGWADADQLEALRAVPGVAAVELERTARTDRPRADDRHGSEGNDVAASYFRFKRNPKR
jgi:hypothetical protein